MQFKDYLATFPTIDHLSGLDILNEKGEIFHHIPAIEGKLGSLKLYYALSKKFNQQLDATSASQGIIWFAEHVEDAKENIGHHPNIDLLLDIVSKNLHFILKPIKK